MRHINDVLKPATIGNPKPQDKHCDPTDGSGRVPAVRPSGAKTRRSKGHLRGG